MTHTRMNHRPIIRALRAFYPNAVAIYANKRKWTVAYKVVLRLDDDTPTGSLYQAITHALDGDARFRLSQKCTNTYAFGAHTQVWVQIPSYLVHERSL